MTLTYKERMEACIHELKSLIGFESTSEIEYQRLFEKHSIIFEVMGYQSNGIPQVEINLSASKKLIPDFLARRHDGLWDIIELKRPDTPILKNPERRTNFYSDFTNYIAQCHEYSEAFSESSVRQQILDKHGLSINNQPDSILIAGRSEGLNRFEIHNVLKRYTPKVRHYTYDDILAMLNRRYFASYGDTQGIKGLSFYEVISLLPYSNKLECIIDIGDEPDKNRISIYRTGNTILKFSLFDNTGLYSCQEVDVLSHSNGTSFVYAIHITPIQSGIIVILEVNGTCLIEHRLSVANFNTAHPIALVCGSDMQGEHNAYLIFGDIIIREPSLNLEERLNLLHYLFDKHGPSITSPPEKPTIQGVKFSGGQCIHSAGHPILDPGSHERTTDLVIRNNDKRPTFAS